MRRRGHQRTVDGCADAGNNQDQSEQYVANHTSLNHAAGQEI
jgi:hypothetical protein